MPVICIQPPMLLSSSPLQSRRKSRYVRGWNAPSRRGGGGSSTSLGTIGNGSFIDLASSTALRARRCQDGCRSSLEPQRFRVDDEIVESDIARVDAVVLEDVAPARPVDALHFAARDVDAHLPPVRDALSPPLRRAVH